MTSWDFVSALLGESEESNRYVAVVERIRRCRSCFMYFMKPRRYLWQAKVDLWFALLVEGDANYWIMRQSQLDAHLGAYRNWLGENRIE